MYEMCNKNKMCLSFDNYKHSRGKGECLKVSGQQIVWGLSRDIWSILCQETVDKGQDEREMWQWRAEVMFHHPSSQVN